MSGSALGARQRALVFAADHTWRPVAELARRARLHALSTGDVAGIADRLVARGLLARDDAPDGPRYQWTAAGQAQAGR